MLATDPVKSCNSLYLLLSQDLEIQQIRETLSLILGLYCSACFTILLFIVTGNYRCVWKGVELDLWIIILGVMILYLGFGLCVVRSYQSTGLRLFGLLSLIQLVCTNIIIAALVSQPTDSYSTKHVSPMKKIRPSPVTFILLSIFRIIIDVIILRLSFKLAKSIRAKISSACTKV